MSADMNFSETDTKSMSEDINFYECLQNTYVREIPNVRQIRKIKTQKSIHEVNFIN